LRGYSVFIVWESDLDNDPDWVISSIIEWINQTSISSTYANNVLTT
jgi:hypothetical protein